MLEVFHKAFWGATGASKVLEGGGVCKGAPKCIDFLPRVWETTVKNESAIITLTFFYKEAKMMKYCKRHHEVTTFFISIHSPLLLLLFFPSSNSSILPMYLPTYLASCSYLCMCIWKTTVSERKTPSYTHTHTHTHTQHTEHTTNPHSKKTLRVFFICCVRACVRACVCAF